MDTSGGSFGQSPPSLATSQASSKRNKPCQQCQKLKVKCERSPNGGPCQRCQAQNKECLYHDFPSKRRKKDPDEYLSYFNFVNLDVLMSWRRLWLL
jgi:Fungal Zn(2)-Cys(6) binuclear cluster domain